VCFPFQAAHDARTKGNNLQYHCVLGVMYYIINYDAGKEIGSQTYIYINKCIQCLSVVDGTRYFRSNASFTTILLLLDFSCFHTLSLPFLFIFFR